MTPKIPTLLKYFGVGKQFLFKKSVGKSVGFGMNESNTVKNKNKHMERIFK